MYGNTVHHENASCPHDPVTAVACTAGDRAEKVPTMKHMPANSNAFRVHAEVSSCHAISSTVCKACLDRQEKEECMSITTGYSGASPTDDRYSAMGLKALERSSPPTKKPKALI